MGKRPLYQGVVKRCSCQIQGLAEGCWATHRRPGDKALFAKIDAPSARGRFCVGSPLTGRAWMVQPLSASCIFLMLGSPRCFEKWFVNIL
jgi:hypothetical protein